MIRVGGALRDHQFRSRLLHRRLHRRTRVRWVGAGSRENSVVVVRIDNRAPEAKGYDGGTGFRGRFGDEGREECEAGHD